MSRNNDDTTTDHLLCTNVREVREERRRMPSQDTGVAAGRPHTVPSRRGRVDDSVGAEAPDATQQSSSNYHHGTLVASTGIPTTTRIPGAEAIPGPGAPRDDEGTVAYSIANETELPVPFPVVDTEEENRMLSEENRILLEQNRTIRERQQGENVAVGQVVATVGAPYLEAKVPATVGYGQDHDNENEESLRVFGLSCGSTKGCRRLAFVTVVLAVLAVAVVVPLVFTRTSGPTTSSSQTTGPAPTDFVPTTAPPSGPTASFPPQDLIDFLSSVSSDGGVALMTPGTPQNLALEWLANNANLASYSEEKKKQRYALAVFYYSTKGDSWWSSDSSWLDDGEECGRWCPCTDSGAVLELNLSNNNLQGSIPPEIGLFSESLEIIDLHWNDISGPVPSEIGQLSNLAYLSLGGCDLIQAIPSEMGLLTNLTWLTLHNNRLIGTIPSSLASLTNLEDLHLYGNYFTGNFSCPELIDCCAISCNDCTACRFL